MINSSEWVLKAILNGCPASSRDVLKRFLSQDERSRLEAMPSTEVNTDLEEASILERVHWSWLLPILKTKPLKEQKLFLSALDRFSNENLCRELKIRTPPAKEKSKIVQEFILQTLTENLVGATIPLLPIYFLPPTPLSPLLYLGKQELIELIDTLSLTDLAIELRQIVETKILKKIYSFLSEEETRILKKAVAFNQNMIRATPLDLKKWDGAEKSLRISLHKRGLARLGAALSLQHHDFIWYICHQLDIGRGTALLKLVSMDIPGSLCQDCMRQIEALLKEAA
ncbi:MAG TPA: hypothetical protein VLE95_07975 [Chlamydiales bacterium]|nr:hypothetical protein [Chlamydiales bacterium]